MSHYWEGVSVREWDGFGARDEGVGRGGQRRGCTKIASVDLQLGDIGRIWGNQIRR